MRRESLQESTKFPSEEDFSDEEADHNTSLFLTEAPAAEATSSKRDFLDVKREMSSMDSRSSISKQTE